MQKINLLIFLIFGLNSLIFSQNEKELSAIESNLNILFEELFLSDGTKFIQADSTKLNLSYEISKIFSDILISPESFEYPFDSLKRIGIRKSQDKKVRVYTWSIKLEKGAHLYYGFIQKKEGNKIRLFPLIDKTNQITELEYQNLNTDNWYGVNYYQIIDFKYNGKKHYALLGMRSNEYISKIKIIEVLYFSGKKAKLGRNVFKYDEKYVKKNAKRILFEYSHKTSMVMNYDERYKMIVFDHLAPENSKLKDIYRFYGPDGSYDAFQYNGQKWIYRPDEWIVNKRNKRQEKLKMPRENKTIYNRNK